MRHSLNILYILLLVTVGCTLIQAIRGRRCSPPPRVENGVLKMTHRGMRIEYSCMKEFNLVGMSYISCNIWGRWNRFPPVCVATGCYNLTPPKHGSVKMSHGNAVARFTCDSGYLLKGSMVLTCNGNKWNGTVPYCKVDKYAVRRDEDAPTVDEEKPQNHPHSTAWERKSHDSWLQEADYTCVGQGRFVVAPNIPNASPFTKFAFVRGEPKLFTIYRCKNGYELQGKKSHLYCVQSEWLGNRQKCTKKLY